MFLPLTPALAGINYFLGWRGNAAMQFNKYGQQLSEKKTPKAETPTPATIRYLLEQAPKVQVSGGQ